MLGASLDISVALRKWTHDHEPTVGLLLLLGLFLSIAGAGIALFTAVKLRYRLAWLVAVMNGVVAAASLYGMGAL